MKLRRITNSLSILGAASAILLGILALALVPVSTYLLSESKSVMANFYLVGAVMLLISLATLAVGFLIIRLIWGPAAEQRNVYTDETDMNPEEEMRGMRVTNTKRVAVLLAVIAAITTAADQMSGGVLVSDTRAVRVLTLLRSPDGQDRADAVNDAIMLAGDLRVRRALQAVLTQPGEAREWAAYAAGIRNDKPLADDLIGLLRSGTDRERSAAAGALARMKNERLLPPAVTAYAEMKTLKGDILKAVGMLGFRADIPKDVLKSTGQFLADLITTPKLDTELKHLAFWAAGRLRAPETLDPIENLLHSGIDTAGMCIGLEAIGRIGSASSSPKLVEALYKFDKSATCPEKVYRDFAGDEVLICTRITVVERLLHEIAHIGDRRARPDILKVSKDESFSPEVRGLAADIAFQMKYKPVEPIPEP